MQLLTILAAKGLKVSYSSLMLLYGSSHGLVATFGILEGCSFLSTQLSLALKSLCALPDLQSRALKESVTVAEQLLLFREVASRKMKLLERAVEFSLQP